MSGKHPILAGILSGLFPGLGQFYCRVWKKGAAFLIGSVLLDAVLGVSTGFLTVLQAGAGGLALDQMGSLFLRSLPFLALAIWSAVDAVRTAKHTASYSR